MKGAVIFTGLMVSAAFTWGADYVVDGAATPRAAREPAGTDGLLELSIDSGRPSYWQAFFTGAYHQFGNDFNVSTISAYRFIKEIRVYTGVDWPNTKWEGFKLVIYNFRGRVVSNLLWGPYFRVPSGPTGWKSFTVNWVFAEGFGYEFLAAAEQCYDLPDCDPHAVDDNPNFLGRSWAYEWYKWIPLEGNHGYRNLMLRVVVADDIGVTPMSLGRVKALYY